MIGIQPRVLRLQALQKFTARPPRLFVEPRLQLVGDADKGVRPPPARLLLWLWLCSRADVALLPSRSQATQELLEQRIDRRRIRCTRSFGGINETLLSQSHLLEQADRIQACINLSQLCANRFRCPWIRQQALIGCCRRMIA